MNFVAIDFETANYDYASICQVGVAIIENGNLAKTLGTYIDPEDDFTHSAIHGITSETVEGCPKFNEVITQLYNILDGKQVICYGGFDIAAFRQAHKKYSLQQHKNEWINVHRMVRRNWKQFSSYDYGLAEMCEYLGIENEKHHDAIHDAVACAKIVQIILSESGQNLVWWKQRIRKPILEVTDVSAENIDGALYGECVLFTGSFQLQKAELANLAIQAGAKAVGSSSKKVTMLIVGNQDLRRTNGKDISLKHQAALDYNAKGGRVRIIKEDDFLALLEVNT